MKVRTQSFQLYSPNQFFIGQDDQHAAETADRWYILFTGREPTTYLVNITAHKLYRYNCTTISLYYPYIKYKFVIYLKLERY